MSRAFPNQSKVKKAFAALVLIAGCLVAGALPAPVLAADDCASAASDPTAAQYCSPTDGGEGRSVSSEGSSAAGDPGGGEVEAAASGGSLPFTGTDLVALAAVGLGLLCLGLALQRLSAAKPETH